MRGSRKFCQTGSISEKYFFSFFLFVDEGKDDPNTTKSGPLSAQQRNAIDMAFRLWADDGPTLNVGLVAF